MLRSLHPPVPELQLDRRHRVEDRCQQPHEIWSLHRQHNTASEMSVFPGAATRPAGSRCILAVRATTTPVHQGILVGDIQRAPTGARWEYNKAMAVVAITCGHCGNKVGAEVVAGDPNTTAWLRCPVCVEGSVQTIDGVIHPPSPAGAAVRNLPPDIERAWREARAAHAVGAYTASEMMCRKILMHLAVDVAKSSPGESFVAYVEALDKEGYITTGLKAVVDAIRSRGNVANHDLPASSEPDSLMTMGVTEHLLRGIYELSASAPG